MCGSFVSEGSFLAEFLVPISIDLYLLACGLSFAVAAYLCYQKNFTAEFKYQNYKNSYLIGILCACMLITSIFYSFSALFDVREMFYYLLLDSSFSWSVIYSSIELVVLLMVSIDGVTNIIRGYISYNSGRGFLVGYNKSDGLLFASKIKGEN